MKKQNCLIKLKFQDKNANFKKKNVHVNVCTDINWLILSSYFSIILYLCISYYSSWGYEQPRDTQSKARIWYVLPMGNFGQKTQVNTDNKHSI